MTVESLAPLELGNASMNEREPVTVENLAPLERSSARGRERAGIRGPRPAETLQGFYRREGQ